MPFSCVRLLLFDRKDENKPYKVIQASKGNQMLHIVKRFFNVRKPETRKMILLEETKPFHRMKTSGKDVLCRRKGTRMALGNEDDDYHMMQVRIPAYKREKLLHVATMTSWSKRTKRVGSTLGDLKKSGVITAKAVGEFGALPLTQVATQRCCRPYFPKWNELWRWSMNTRLRHVF